MGTTYTVSDSCACTWMGKPKSLGRLPLTSYQLAPASSLRITSQCFCMNSRSGFDGCIARRCTQWPISAVGSGRNPECRPRLMVFQVRPPSSVRNEPAAEMATNIRSGSLGSSRIVCRHIPPAPGIHAAPVSWPRRPASSCHDSPPSVVRNSAASSTPAYATSGSVSDGSTCHTRANSHGCCVPSYHWWVVRGRPVSSEVS